MANIDNMLRQVLGKGKNKRQSLGFNINKILGKLPKTDFGVKSIIGKPARKSLCGASPFMQQSWKSFSPNFKQILRKRLPDTDGDRVPDIFDCSPRNLIRQDKSDKHLIIISPTSRKYVRVNRDVYEKNKEKELKINNRREKILYNKPKDLEFIYSGQKVLYDKGGEFTVNYFIQKDLQNHEKLCGFITLEDDEIIWKSPLLKISESNFNIIRNQLDEQLDLFEEIGGIDR